MGALLGGGRRAGVLAWIQSLRGLVRNLGPEPLQALTTRGGRELAQLLPELRERLPDLPPPESASPEVARFRLFDTLTAFLRSASEAGPLVMILEDLHAADASSLLLLQFVADELAGTRLLVVATYRDLELTREHPLAAALPELGRVPGTARLSLSGLSAPDVARFVETITGRTPPPDLVVALHRETEGNPLFVGEVVRLLASEGRLRRPPPGQRWPIPEGVRGVIGRRLDRLSQDCRGVLTLASVVGQLLGRGARAGRRPVCRKGARRIARRRRGAPHRRCRGRPWPVPVRARAGPRHAVRGAVAGQSCPAPSDVGAVLESRYAVDPEPHVAELAYHFSRPRRPATSPRALSTPWPPASER